MSIEMPKAVKEVYKILENYDLHKSIIQLDNTARSAADAANCATTFVLNGGLILFIALIISFGP